MPFPPIVVVAIFGVLCLTPVALYLNWLGVLNRRPRPTVVGGPWDFAALVAGLSGVLLFGGGLLVAAVYSDVRLVARGNFEQIQAAWAEERVAWAAVALGYAATVAGVVALTLAARRRSLAVYNVDRDQSERAVDAALAAAGVAGSRFGDVWAADGRAVVSVRTFDGFRHATVTLLTPDDRLAEEIERGLRHRLTTSCSGDNPFAGVLTGLSVGCLLVMLLCVLLVAYFLYLAG